MQYLIDGHNLIGKMPDISIQDPDDEVQLILRLRSWTAASKKRQVTVYFDGGIPGGKNVKLSTPQVRVVFASAGRTADALLINRIQKARNPAEFVLVSNDQEIIKAAQARKLEHVRSEKFAMRLGKQWQDTIPGPTLTDDDPQVSDLEIQEWLATFGPVDEEALQSRPKPVPPTRKKVDPEADEATADETYEPASNNREEPVLSKQELGEWLELFEKTPAPPPPENKPAKTGKPAARKKRKPIPNPHNLPKEDIQAWHDFINRDDSPG